MAGKPERVLLADANLDMYIGLLQTIIDALTDAKGGEHSFTSVCKNHGLNAKKVRQYLMSLPKCQLMNTIALQDLIVDDFDNYEFFYRAVFGESDLIKVKAMLPYDYKESVEYILNETDLTEREVRILQHRFGLTEDERRLTLEEIGNMLGVTRDRIRQIEAKALRKVRMPQRNRILVKGLTLNTLEEEQKLQAHQTIMEDKKRIYQEELEAELKQQRDNCNDIKNAVSQISFEELELSIRSCNCLYRAQAKTIGDVLERTTLQLIKVRNMGRKTIIEIQEKLDDYLQFHYHISLSEYHHLYHFDELELYSPMV